MVFLKKYWWVFALLIGGFLIYWFNFREKSTGSNSKGFVCNNTKAEWNNKLATKIAYLRTDAAWMTKLNADVTAGTYPNIDAALASAADWSLRIEDKQCNPNYPLNSKDQFGV